MVNNLFHFLKYFISIFCFTSSFIIHIIIFSPTSSSTSSKIFLSLPQTLPQPFPHYFLNRNGNTSLMSREINIKVIYARFPHHPSKTLPRYKKCRIKQEIGHFHPQRFRGYFLNVHPHSIKQTDRTYQNAFLACKNLTYLS